MKINHMKGPNYLSPGGGHNFSFNIINKPIFKTIIENAPVKDTRISPTLKPNIPKTIKTTYSTDLSIIEIHNTIFDKMQKKLNMVNFIADSITKLRSQLSNSDLTIIDKREIQEKIDSRTQEIEELESGSLWESYAKKAIPLLKQYQPLSTYENKNVVKLGNKKDEFQNDPNLVKRLNIIQDYLDVASKYIDLDIIWEGPKRSKCPSCLQELEDIGDDIGSYKCRCGFIMDNIDNRNNYVDTPRVNYMIKNYNSCETFEKNFSRWEGSSNDTIPQKLIDKLDEYFKGNSFPTSAEIKKMPTLPNGKKAGTCLNIMIEALKNTGYSVFNSVVYPLIYTYWDWDRPKDDEVVIRIKPLIMEKYHEGQIIYEAIKTRDSCLNINIRLYSLLKAYDYNCDINDFKFLTQYDCLEYHDTMLRIMHQRTGIKYDPII